jgi:hypothetical protein
VAFAVYYDGAAIMQSDHGTRESIHPHSHEERQAILREMEQILSSPQFCNSKRYPALLEFIVRTTLDGRASELKERTLGIEVFGRNPTYDTNSDTIVRYTAGEVRKRLLLYYSEHASHSGVRIALPPGSYVPEFQSADDHHQELDRELEAHLPEAAEAEVAAHAPASDHSAAEFRSLSRRVLLIAAAVAVLVLAAVAFAWWRMQGDVQQETAVDDFWAPVLRDQHSIVLCTGSVVFDQTHYSGVTTAHRDLDYTFVSMQIASAITQIANTVNHAGQSTQLVYSAVTPITELRERSVVLLGAYNNDLTMRLLGPLRYHFPLEPDEGIADRTKGPQAILKRDRTQPYSSTADYAIVARFRDSTTDGWVVVLAGLGRNGTEAAAQFATSPRYLTEVRNRLGSGFAKNNLEVVLKIDVVEGKTGAPTILDVHTW